MTIAARFRSRAVAAANRVWRRSCAEEARAFGRAIGNARLAQRDLLASILRRNASSAFGSEHGFSSVHGVRDFRCQVPIRSYEGFRPYIDRIAAGESRVLTGTPVHCLQPTSGSTRRAKLIPYTADLRREFQRAIRVWVADLFANRPHLMNGPSYWSISPVSSLETRSAGGVRVGFEDDVEYLDPASRALARLLLTGPADLRRVEEINIFRRATLAFLVASRDLALVSVWNPTFFTLLLDELDTSGDRIADAVESGRLATLGPFEKELRARLERHLVPMPDRADLLRAILGDGVSGHGLRRLWPRLSLVSCWSDANSAGPARELERRLPWCELQPKGLVATEGFVSIPLVGRDGAALAIRSHFLELEPEGESNATLEAHEAEVGRRYNVVLTTGGGLYRYRLGDLVEVVGRMDTCPLVRFVGRGDRVSDWYGEKLHETHVSELLTALLPRGVAFTLVSCEPVGESRAYILFLDAAEVDSTAVAGIARRFDAGLRDNFHYAYCRDLGQLEPAQVVLVPDASRRYLEARCEDGARLGDVKPPVLEARGGWLRRLGATARDHTTIE